MGISQVHEHAFMGIAEAPSVHPMPPPHPLCHRCASSRLVVGELMQSGQCRRFLSRHLMNQINYRALYVHMMHTGA